MKVEKIYRNHKSGQELITVVEKPDDFFMIGSAHVQKFNEHGDVVEECVSPNIITNWLKDQIGRLLFNTLAIPGIGNQALGVQQIWGNSSMGNTSQLVDLLASQTNSSPAKNAMSWPFGWIALSNYAVAENATELYTSGALLAWQRSDALLASPFSTVATGGNSFTMTYDWTPTSFSGTINSVLWCNNPTAATPSVGVGQGARTLLPAPIVKTTSDALRVQYTFTYTP